MRVTRGAAASVIAAVALLLSLLVAPPATAAPIAPADALVATSPVDAVAGSVADTGIVKSAVVGFNPENIIDDSLFYDGNAMSATEIQSFLDSKIGRCENGKCLNVLTASISSRDAWYSQATGNLVCSALQGGTMRISELIYRVQVACGISAKAILVTLQKEQGLTTSSAPSDWNLRAAMGASCPDTEPCDPAYSGVGPQIVQGVRQLKIYKAGKFAKQPGVNFIGYNPNSACGGTNINIQNYATAALYNYTPYQPNAAALAAGWGLGDGCSSYGNRNFYNYYTSWFGSTQASVDPCRAPAADTWTTSSDEVVTTADLNGRKAPTTACPTILKTFPSGTILSRVATYGQWSRVLEYGAYYWVHNDYLAIAPAVSWKTDRLAGADRYETAAAVSRATSSATGGVVFLASGQDFPDALTAAAAAAKASGTLLLTRAGGLPEVTRAEIIRLAPSKIVVVGGAAVVSDAVVADAVRAVPGVQVTRIGGMDRYETSILLAQELFGTAPSVYMATGVDFADALAASSIAGAAGMPVILVKGTSDAPSSQTLADLADLGTKNVTVAGGPGAVSDGIVAALRGSGLAVTRYGGANRYETSQLMNAAAYRGVAATVIFATGVDFPDALTGAVLAARTKAPLFSQPSGCVRPATKDWMIAHGAKSLRLIGGAGALSDAVAQGRRC